MRDVERVRLCSVVGMYISIDGGAWRREVDTTIEPCRSHVGHGLERDLFRPMGMVRIGRNRDFYSTMVLLYWECNGMAPFSYSAPYFAITETASKSFSCNSFFS
jgi:hypothetical protein